VFAQRHVGEFDDRTHDSICVCAMSVNELQEITGMVIWHFKKVNCTNWSTEVYNAVVESL